MLAGRPPAAPDEIALGAQTLRLLPSTRRASARRSLSPSSRSRPTCPACGATCASRGWPCCPRSAAARSLPPASAPGPCTMTLLLSVLSVPDAADAVPHQAHLLQLFPVRLRPGTDAVRRGGDVDRLHHQGGLPAGLLRGGQRPAAYRHQGLRQRQGHPARARRRAVIVFAVGTLAHVLLTGVRLRCRDLALLKTLGFERSQVLGVVAWEASAFAAVALAIGLPLGVLAGLLGLGLLRQRGRAARPASRLPRCCSPSLFDLVSPSRSPPGPAGPPPGARPCSARVAPRPDHPARPANVLDVPWSP